MGFKRSCRPFREHKRALILLLTPVLLLIILPYYEVFGLTQRACNCLYMLLLMAVYWCTETLPLAVTALIPIPVAPMMGILKSSAVCENYFKDKIALLFGSMIIACSIQHSGLHRRIALSFIRLTGTNPKFLMLGFMLPTWLLSMWISNTVTTVMIVSILNCVLLKLKEEDAKYTSNGSTTQGENSKRVSNNGMKTEEMELLHLESQPNRDQLADSRSQSAAQKRDTQSSSRYEPLAKCLSLAVCYSATAGGIATLTGTGTNLVFYDNIVEFGEKLDYDFGVSLPQWMLFALPVSILMLVIIWIWLQVFFIGCRQSLQSTTEDRKKISEVIASEYATLGSMSWEEGVTLIHLIILVLLWLTRNPGSAGGWSQLFEKGYVTDTTASMLMAISLLLMPKYPPLLFRMETSRPYQPLLAWKIASEKLAWTALFLLAGGLALADCVNKSGLSAAIGGGLSSLSHLPLWLMILILCLITAGVTEFSSNIVIGAIFMPILGNLAIEMQINPLLLMIPCTVACSFAFMLPVATPPNAVVYTNGILNIRDMILAGALMNLVGISLIMLATFTWLPAVFHFSDFRYDNLTDVSATLTSTVVSAVGGPDYNTTVTN